jgi:hypothetical protein
MDFFSFEAALLRLKGALLLQTDKEVAAALGMDPSAFNKRKARGSFPESEVRALAERELFDAEYVISGVAQAALEMIEAAEEGRPLQKVSTDERALLLDYRSCSATDRHAIRRHAASLAATGKEKAAPLAPDGQYPKREEVHPMTQHDKPRKKGA